MIRNVLLLFIIALALSASISFAKDVKQLSWPDLIPNQEPIKDPLDALPPDQLDDFTTLVLAKNTLESGLRVEDRSLLYEDITDLERKFAKLGVNVNKLYTDYRAFEEKLAKRGTTLVGTLDDTKVKIGGYLLPLEFSGKGETEFLLVPYVGACIHVPPPPANQVVYVRLKTPYQVQDLYTPVRITGQLTTKRTSKSLSLVDGSAGINVGYSLDGEAIEKYQE
ncbi:MAG: DUF3299 domain-containing protein [Methyloligellaceae bacterium]